MDFENAAWVDNQYGFQNDIGQFLNNISSTDRKSVVNTVYKNVKKEQKLGDIFSVMIDDSMIKYFQLIAFDFTQLNSDIIRAFKEVYPPNVIPGLSTIINGEIDFFAHCVTKIGLQMQYWKAVGNIAEVGPTSGVLFRDTKTMDTKIRYPTIGMSGESMIKT